MSGTDPERVWVPGYTGLYEDLIRVRSTDRATEDMIALDSDTQGAHTIIEIGCGPGNSSRVLSRLYPNAKIILGIDINPGALQSAKKDFSASDSPQIINFALADALVLPLRGKIAQRVICCNSFHWFAYKTAQDEETIDNLKISLAEIFRILDEGFLLFNTSALQFDIDPKEVEALRLPGIHYLEHPFHEDFIKNLNALLNKSGIPERSLINPHNIDKYHHMFNPKNLSEILNESGFSLVREVEKDYKITPLMQTPEQLLVLIKNGGRHRYFNYSGRQEIPDDLKDKLVEEALTSTIDANSEHLAIPSYALFISFKAFPVPS